MNDLKKGDAAPLFCLKDSKEKKVCLKDMKGRNVVLYFYPRDNTPGCTLEGINFTKKLAEFKKIYRSLAVRYPSGLKKIE